MSSCCPGCGKWYPKRPEWYLRQHFLRLVTKPGDMNCSRARPTKPITTVNDWTYLSLQMCAPRVASLADVLPGAEVAVLLVLPRAYPVMLSCM